MANTISIGAKFWVKHSPKELLQLYIDNGWEPGYEDSVYFVKAKDDIEDDDYVKKENFSLEDFINSHDQLDSVRIKLTRGEFSGIFLIDADKISIALGNIVYLDDGWGIPDFSWYLKQLLFFFEKVGIVAYSCEVFG